MSPTWEAITDALKRLWTKIVSFAEALDVIDDPVGDYNSRLENASISSSARCSTSRRNCIRALAAAEKFPVHPLGCSPDFPDPQK